MSEQSTQQERDPHDVYCPHCGENLGYYNDWVPDLGSYYVVDTCDYCGKALKVYADFAFSVYPAHMDEVEPSDG